MTQVNLRTSVDIKAIDLVTSATSGKAEGLKFTGTDGKVYEIFATPVGAKGVMIPETASSAGDAQAIGRVVYGGTEYVYTLLESDATTKVTIDGTVYAFDATGTILDAAASFAAMAEDVKSLGTTGDIDIQGSI